MKACDLRLHRTRNQLGKFVDNLIGMLGGKQNFGGGILAGGLDPDGETTYFMCVIDVLALVT